MPSTTPAQPRRRDRRRDRHEATKREILDTAWSMVRADGLAALSLRALAHAVDMEPQSLYTYFASKNALYNRMFADGNQELARRFADAEIADEARSALRAVASTFVEFAAQDPARYQLLFLRTIPGFQPSPESYATAVEVLASVRTILTRAGLRNEADFDLWTAVVAGRPASNSPTTLAATATSASSTTPSPCSPTTSSARADRSVHPLQQHHRHPGDPNGQT